MFLIDCSPADVGLGDDHRVHALRRAHRRTRPPTFVDQEIDEDDYAVIFYTSGTTGKPKGAISTHRSMVANLQNTMFNARRRVDEPAARRAAADPAGGQNVVAVHLAAVPRVGLPLHPRGRACWPGSSS